MAEVEAARGRGPSVAELVETLQSAIVAGDLVPNQRLIEADIAAEYGASRGTVRAALSELTVEGLVERLQNRGARVRAVSVEEAVEITEVRGALEALCARRAAERITDGQATDLRALARRMREAVAEGDRELYSECARSLHAAILEISGQNTAAATIRRLKGQAAQFQSRLALQPGRPRALLPQHLEIIEAVCAHDGAAAAEAVLVHLGRVVEAIRATESQTVRG
ncbi:GntR family transcriptional regulator [Sinomonas atrocyanea]|uniref:GntR family transcriptional regulator n=1 Tax=Sinomonas atrocyanea TaxID=37927 RepID=UPI003D983A73